LLRRLVNNWRQYADNYLGDYYPLTPYSLTPDSWMAWQFDQPEKGKGMVQVFRRAKSIYESARLKLQGLEPGARYTVRNLEEPAAEREWAGRELMEKGLGVTLANQPAATVIVYRKLEGQSK
jgi:alpha-galactosidase